MDKISGAVTTFVQGVKDTGVAINNSVGPMGKAALLTAINLQGVGAQSEQNCTFRDAYNNLTSGEKGAVFGGSISVLIVFAILMFALGNCMGRRVVHFNSEVEPIDQDEDANLYDQTHTNYSGLVDKETSSFNDQYQKTDQKTKDFYREVGQNNNHLFERT